MPQSGLHIISRSSKPPKVTEDTVKNVSGHVCQGIALRHALALETPIIPYGHWVASLQGSTKLAAIYAKGIAEGIRDMMGKVRAAECLRKMPPEVWLLERLFPEDYGQTKSPTSVTINQTVIGVGQDILARSAELVRRRTPEEIAARAQDAAVMRANRRPGRPKNNGMDVIDVASQSTPEQ